MIVNVRFAAAVSTSPPLKLTLSAAPSSSITMLVGVAAALGASLTGLIVIVTVFVSLESGASQAGPAPQLSGSPRSVTL